MVLCGITNSKTAPMLLARRRLSFLVVELAVLRGDMPSENSETHSRARPGNVKWHTHTESGAVFMSDRSHVGWMARPTGCSGIIRAW